MEVLRTNAHKNDGPVRGGLKSEGCRQCLPVYIYIMKKIYFVTLLKYKKSVFTCNKLPVSFLILVTLSSWLQNFYFVSKVLFWKNFILFITFT